MKNGVASGTSSGRHRMHFNVLIRLPRLYSHRAAARARPQWHRVRSVPSSDAARQVLHVGAVILRNTRRVQVLLSSAFAHQAIFRAAARAFNST